VPHATVFFVPFIFAPLILFTLGLAWIFASLGVFFRDIGQITGILTMVLMFLCPIFYPLDSIPEKYQAYIKLNPLTFFVQQMREVVVIGHQPDWSGLVVALILGALVANIGLYLFYRTKRAFADVI